MKQRKIDLVKRFAAMALIAAAVFMTVACGSEGSNVNLVESQEGNERIVNLFSPMEKTDPNAENVARSAADKTIIMAEEKLGVTLNYVTYTAEDYQDKTYDDVALDRARNHMDDLYLLNPDVIQMLGEEGLLY